jgi:large subunit ribosomal protein L4
MAEVEVKNLKNKVVGKLELADEVFEYQARKSLVWEAVRAYRASQRKGTHSAKNRSAVVGGGQKPWRQKGTGRARVGSLRSPLRKGGGTIHGPQPRDYVYSFPKKKRRGAVKLVLTDKLKNNRILVVDELEMQSHKTKEFLELLKTLELEGKVLLVDSKENRRLYLSSRNVRGATTISTGSVNIYDLLRHETLLISKAAILELQEVLKR